MEEERSHSTLKILNLTLEIISLLTGENFPVVMSGDHVIIHVPPPLCLILEITKERKILKVIKKIVELMTGERVRPKHVTFAVKEVLRHEENGGSAESETSEGRKNVEMRSRRPPCSQSSRQEEVPHHEQVERLKDMELKPEDGDGSSPVRGDHEGAERMLIKEEELPAEVSTEDNMEEEDDDDDDGDDGARASEDEHIINSEAADGSAEPPSSHAAPPGGGDRVDDKICSECSKGFKSKSALLIHQRIHSGERPYSCLDCGKRFIRKEHLSQHRVTHTGERRFPCPECGKRFTQRASLIKHQRTHMVLAQDIEKALEGLHTLFPDNQLEEGEVVQDLWGKSRPSSDVCPGRCEAPTPDRSHPAASSPEVPRERKPPERRPDPPYPQNSTRKRQTIQSQNQADDLADIVVKVEEEEVCVMDGQWSAERAGLLVIVKAEDDLTDTGVRPIRKPSVGRLGSPDCKLEDGGEEDTQDSEDNPVTSESPFADQSVDASHHGSSSHNNSCNQSFGDKGGEKFSCSTCGKCFTYQYALRKHMRVHTGERPFPCFQCGKRFIWRENLLQHQIIHSGKKPHSCSECGKSFIFKSVLARHFRTHTGVKPFSCSECGKCFPMKAKLEAHFRIHTGERPFSCAECGKRFTLKGRLTRHMRRHSGEKMLMCGVCGKCFMEKSDLVSHQKIHTGERPFACSDCGSRFRKKSDLYRHIKIHTGEKPFACNECGFRSARKSELAIHIRTHTGEKPFICLVCQKSFSRSSSLRSHQRDHSHYSVVA